MGNSTQGLKEYVLKDLRAACVSARQERVSARYVRAARSVFRVITATGWGFGVSVDGFRAEEGALAPSWLKASRILKEDFVMEGTWLKWRGRAQMEGSTSRFAAV